MRRIMALVISLIFVVTLTMTIGCPKQEAPKPTPPAAPATAPEKPAEQPAPPAPAPAAPEKK